MGIESLTPNPAPKPEQDVWKGQLVWEASDEQDFPWNDPRKQHQLKELEKRRPLDYPTTWRYVLYAGIIPMEPVIGELCRMLGTSVSPDSEFPPREPAATLALMLDEQGFVVSDKVFFSCMPWAIGKVMHTPDKQPLQFFGFAGTDGFAGQITARIAALMEDRCIFIPDRDDGSAGLDDDAEAAQASTQTQLHPVNLADIDALLDGIFGETQWKPSEMLPGVRIEARRISTRSLEDGKDPDIGVLNSFYPEDLSRVAAKAASGQVGQALRSFVKAQVHSERIDLREETGIAFQRQAVMPEAMPLGCWPSTYPLVYNQQFAVNNIFRELDGRSGEAGIFSVNGPPGTGKTTLLRDVIAAIVVKRACSLAQFEKPQDALGAEIEIEWDLTNAKAYRLHPSLRNQGIVVVSANNGAVENVTKELPGIGAIPKHCTLRYFPELSDTLAMEDGKEQRRPPRRAVNATWGAIAGVMGKSENRKTFFNRFGKAAHKDVQKIEQDLAEGLPMSLPSLVQVLKADAPSWEHARKAFADALDRVLEGRTRMQEIALALQDRQALQPGLSLLQEQAAQVASRADAATLSLQRAQQEAEAANARQAQARLAHDLARRWHDSRRDLDRLDAEFGGAPFQGLLEALHAAEEALGIADDDVTRTSRQLDTERSKKPSRLRSLFSSSATRNWEREVGKRQVEYDQACERRSAARGELSRLRLAEKNRQSLQTRVETARDAHAAAHRACTAGGLACPPNLSVLALEKTQSEQAMRAASGQLQPCRDALENAQRLQDKLRRRIAEVRQQLSASQATLDRYAVSPAMAAEWMHVDMDDEDIQKSSPWFDEEWFAARQDLFAAALALQQSFIIHAWGKIRNTLLAVEKLANGSLKPDKVEGSPADLWDMFFLVIPVVSTTFASFPRMFAGWDAESIGWLLIDEAGQATPQQALGPIWRSRRAVVVGDPKQLEPVVALPAEVFKPLMQRCRARREFHPATCSVQVLADMANRIGTVIGDDEQGQWVGSPLRVHRRCLNPMFDVANTVAYDGMMVYGTSEPEAADGAHAPSGWYDLKVEATQAVGNCVPLQIDLAEVLAHRFVEKHGLKDDKGKFKVYLITPFREVNTALDSMLYRKWKKDKNGMHGTVHTFQGKEAEVVIFVLGGNPGRKGAIQGFAAAKPNLLNVAVTRAKQHVYVIGDYDLWRKYPYFDTLAESLTRHQVSPDAVAKARSALAGAPAPA